jgi:hypothetical protein
VKNIMLVFSLLVFAGTCLADFSPNYDTYINYSVDENDNIIQTVMADGTTTGDCWLNNGTYWVPGCPAYHYVSYVNTLNGVGTGQPAPGGDMFSYISFQDTVTFAAQGGASVPSSVEIMITCSAGLIAIIDTTLINHGFSLAHTYFAGPLKNNNLCFYSRTACSPGTAPSCQNQPGWGFTSGCPGVALFRYLKIDGACQPPLARPSSLSERPCD